MERLIDIVRFVLISGETAILLVILVCAYYFPSYFEVIGSSVKTYSDVWRWLPGIPGICIVASIKLTWRVLTPWGNLNTKILYQWPKYWRLKYRVVASIIICVMSVGCSIIIWFFPENFSEINLGIISVSLVAIPIVSLLCELQAALSVRELLDKYS